MAGRRSSRSRQWSWSVVMVVVVVVVMVVVVLLEDVPRKPCDVPFTPGEISDVLRGADPGGLLPGRCLCSFRPKQGHRLAGTLVALCLLLPCNVVSIAGQSIWRISTLHSATSCDGASRHGTLCLALSCEFRCADIVFEDIVPAFRDGKSRQAIITFAGIPIFWAMSTCSAKPSTAS